MTKNTEAPRPEQNESEPCSESTSTPSRSLSQDAVHRASLARNLLADDVFNEAYQDVLEDVMREWTEEKDPDARENLWFELQALQRMVRKLASYFRTVEFEKANRERIN